MNPYIKLAIEEAKKGIQAGKGGPFGAVIVKDGQILSKACNEVLSSNDPTAHAEVLAIRRASEKLQTFDLSGCVIYATGEPCPMCLAAIIWANIKEVYFAASVKEAAKIGFRDDLIYRYLRGEENILKVKEIKDEEILTLYQEYKGQHKLVY